MRSYQRDVDGRRRRGLPGAAMAIGLAAIGAALAAAMPLPARAETDYPNRPVRVFIPYGPGGVADVTMRLLAQKVGEEDKQQCVIENRPGAGGLLAVKGVLDSPPDGYTLGVVGNGQAIGVSLFKNRTYNPLTDFTHVAITARFEMLLGVSGASPYRTLQDVVAAARKNPGKLNLGAINPGSTQNLSAHMFKQVTGAEFTVVTYRTTPELVTALLRGDVDLGFDYYAGFIGEIADGKLRIVATSGDERDSLLKDIPTAKESGFPQYVVTSWNGVAGPAGLPDEDVQTP